MRLAALFCLGLWLGLSGLSAAAGHSHVPVRSFEGHHAAVYSVAVTPDGQRIVSGHSDGAVILWDLDTGAELRRFEQHISYPAVVAVTPDGKRIVSGDGGTVLLWDLDTGARLRRFKVSKERAVSSIAVTADGRRIIAADNDGVVFLWNLDTGALLRRFDGPTDHNVNGVAVTPDGKRLLSVSYDDTIVIWDVDSGKLLRRFEAHTGGVLSVVVTSDGKRFLSGGHTTGIIKLWDVDTGAELRRFEGHANGVSSIAVTRDGKRFASGGEDLTVRLWDLETGAELNRFGGHVGTIASVALTPDGKRLVSGSHDDTVRLWDVPALGDATVIAANQARQAQQPAQPSGQEVSNELRYAPELEEEDAIATEKVQDAAARMKASLENAGDGLSVRTEASPRPASSEQAQVQQAIAEKEAEVEAKADDKAAGGLSAEERAQIEKDRAELAGLREHLAELSALRERLAALEQQKAEPARPEPAPAAAPKPAFDPGKRIALVIGNSAYSHVPLLKNPANDAKAVADSLRKLGFAEVIEKHDLTLGQLSAELQTFGDRAFDADWALIYFAGHGVEVGRVNYLIPVDAELKAAAHVDFQAVPLDRATGAVGGARQLRLVILDACRDNPFIQRMASRGGTRSVGRGLARVEPQDGVLVAYAAEDGQVALDGDGANSPFASALVQHLEEPGLEVGLLFRRVATTVRKVTGDRQVPFTYGSLTDAEFYFKAAN